MIEKEGLDEERKVIWNNILHLATSKNSDQGKKRGLEIVWTNLYENNAVAEGEKDVTTVVQNLLKYFGYRFPATQFEVITSETITVKPTKLAKDNFPYSTFYNEPTIKLNPVSTTDGSIMDLQKAVSEAFRKRNLGTRYLIREDEVWECNGSTMRMKLTKHEPPADMVFEVPKSIRDDGNHSKVPLWSEIPDKVLTVEIVAKD